MLKLVSLVKTAHEKVVNNYDQVIMHNRDYKAQTYWKIPFL